LIGRLSPFGFGHSLLAGVLVLSLMTLPLAALTVDTALGAVPRDYLAAAAALGLSRRAVVWHIAVPVAWRGVLAGVLLQTARALGETMAVLMVCGNVVQLPTSFFTPVRLLTANIALEMGYATAFHRSALFVSGLWLMVIAAVLVLGAQWLERECPR
jgi:phosphate transport system permease protein